MERKDFLAMTSVGLAGLFLSPKLHASTLDRLFEAPNKNYDALIIGTGYGSAVSALRLAEANKKVLMLEMGMNWETSGIPFSKMAWAKKQSTWLRRTTIAPFGNYRTIDKFTGVLDRMDFEHVKVYAGRGIGGGSIANGGMSVTPKKNYFAEIFPDLDTEKFYSTYFPLANEELGVTTIPEEYYQESKYYEFSRIGEAEARKAGFKTIRVPNVYDFDYMKKEEAGEVPKSALAGEVIYGNNYGKKDLTKTYLKKALATDNVTIKALHKADTIIDNSDGTYTIKINQIDTKGRTVRTKKLKTNRLFIGAGSIGTVEILLKSKAKGTLSKVNDEVGKYWGNNGNCMSGRNFVSNGTGTKQSTIPAAGVDNWEDPEHPFFTEIAPLPLGMETYSSLYLTINRVPKHGEITYNKNTEQVEINWDKSHYNHMIENTKYFINKINKVNGGTYARLLFDNGIGPKICYHPLGGCVLGKATDQYGRLKDLPGIYVVDGSLIPGTIGVNPYVTITAIAEYCIENIIEEDFPKNNRINNHEIKSLKNIKISPEKFTNYVEVEYESLVDGEHVEMTITNRHNIRLVKREFETVKGHNKNTLKGLWFLWGGKYDLKMKIGNEIFTKQIKK